MVRILEHSRGYYDCREVPRGTEYVWRPARFVLECGCGEKTLLLGFLDGSRCLCGADLAASVRKTPGHAPWKWRMRTTPGVLRTERSRAPTGTVNTTFGRS